jgi:hypothetical protein
MSNPRSVRVGPFRFTIRWSTKAIRELEREFAEDLYGTTDPDTQTIFMHSRLSHDRARVTLLHEILHACFHAADYPLSHKREEKAVSALAPVLLAVLRDNPHIVTYLIEEQQ